MKSSRKCQIFVIFLIAEIYKIDLEALFFGILKQQTPHGKDLDLWVKIQFVQKQLSGGEQILQRSVFRFGHVTTFFGHALDI